MMEEWVPGQRDSIERSLRSQKIVPDGRFDVVFPREWRLRSARYWTPIDVALRAAAWLTDGGAARVLDIGSGVGKVCIVGALSTRAAFVGLEQRAPLVAAARAAADTFGVGRLATFVCGSIDAFDASSFDAFYLYNPFGENLYSPMERLDDTVELSQARYSRDTRCVESILSRAPVGARLVTYHGFGGHVPNSYAPERIARIGSDALRLWVKRRPQHTGYYVEIGVTGLRLEPCEMRDDDGPRTSIR
jgi:predicted RNA methylase